MSGAVLCVIRYDGLFWRENAAGYTSDLFQAGLFPEDFCKRRLSVEWPDIRNDRGDFYTPLKQYLADRNITGRDLDIVEQRVDLFRSMIEESKQL